MGKAKIYSKLEAVTAEGILGDAAQIGTVFRFRVRRIIHRVLLRRH